MRIVSHDLVYLPRSLTHLTLKIEVKHTVLAALRPAGRSIDNPNLIHAHIHNKTDKVAGEALDLIRHNQIVMMDHNLLI